MGSSRARAAKTESVETALRGRRRRWERRKIAADPAVDIDALKAKLAGVPTLRPTGRVRRRDGARAALHAARACASATSCTSSGAESRSRARSWASTHGEAVAMALGALAGVGPDDEVETTGAPLQVRASGRLLGRVVDGLGRPIDGGPPSRVTLVAVDRRPAERARRGARHPPPRDGRARPRRAHDARRRATRSASSRARASARARCSARSRAASTPTPWSWRSSASAVARWASSSSTRSARGAREERRRGRHERRTRARAAPRRPSGDGVRRVLPRCRQAGHAPRRFGHALRARSARGGARRRRAPGATRLSAERLRRAPSPPRAFRAGAAGVDHGDLHRARRGGRYRRADRRRDPRHPRRTRRPRPHNRGARPLPRGRRDRLALARDGLDRLARAPRVGGARCAGMSRRTRRSAIS